MITSLVIPSAKYSCSGRERLDAARESFGRFGAAWDGSPPSLTVYVDDIGRYLASH